MVGSGVESGSDPEMEDENFGAEGGDSEWSTVGNRKRKKNRRNESETESENGLHVTRGRKEEFKVLLKLDAGSFSVINPLKLSKVIKEKIGLVESVKKLRDGRLIIYCKDSRQQKKALEIKTIMGQGVNCSVQEEKKWVKGVITGIPTDVTEEKIKKGLTGGAVIGVKRLKCNRNNERGDSLSVMIQFDEDKLPSKVFLGFMSFSVRLYVPPPLRCYKCQKFGHVAAVCRGKQRCARCGGEHEYGKCEQGVDPKCCNCGGKHSAGYGGCEVRKNAAQVQNVRIKEGLSYSEAVKKVGNTLESGDKGKGIPQQKMETAQGKTKENFGIKNNVAFVTFIAEVVNCSAQTESRTERIRIIIKAAEKYLEIEGISVEMISEKLKMQLTNTQAGCGGS